MMNNGMMANKTIWMYMQTSKISTLIFYSDINCFTDCTQYGPLGMEDKTILDTQLSASSFHNGFLGDYVAQKARLNGASYWATAEQNAPNPWIQVDFLTSANVKIFGIQTQGGTLTTAPYNTEWVTTLQIQTGDSIDLLEYIMNGNDSMVRSILFFSFIT